MEQHADTPATGPLAALVGEWTMVPDFGGGPPPDGAPVVFEWMPGQRFLVQRWQLPDSAPKEAPSAGIALIGADPESEGNFLQHYFDSRGVARLYKMTLSDGVWTLWRDSPDFGPLDFAQRYTGTFSEDGRTISGAWEICHDGGTWEHDFDVTYSKVS